MKEVARLKAKIEKLSVGSKNEKAGQKKKAGGSKDFPKRNLTAKRNHTSNKKRVGTAGPGADSLKGKGGGKKNLSKNKPAGKKGSSKTGKRS